MRTSSAQSPAPTSASELRRPTPAAKQPSCATRMRSSPATSLAPKSSSHQFAQGMERPRSPARSRLRRQGRQPAGPGRPHRRLRPDARIQHACSARSASSFGSTRLTRPATTWRGCQAAAPDLVAWGWEEENPGVAVGASLELSGHAAAACWSGATPFSDAGIRENVMGSFLGNYHYDPGEQLGDVVLVATTTYGRGRIVVWGDTSAFQGGLSTNYRKVVGPMLAWLSRPAAWTEMPASAHRRRDRAAWLVVLWCWIVAATPKQIAWISVEPTARDAGPLGAESGRTSMPAPHVDRDAFLIDRSHLEATGHYEAKVNPIGPLYTNLFRSGFRVLDIDAWDSDAIDRARGIAFVAPQKSFTRGEVEELLRAEQNGAVVILATGQPDSAGSRPLLDAHGLALVPRPLGTVTPAEPTASRREREQQPRFLDAWPIVAAGERDPATLPGVEVIYRHGDDVVALFRRMGKGGTSVDLRHAVLLGYECGRYVRLLAGQPRAHSRRVQEVSRGRPGCREAAVPVAGEAAVRGCGGDHMDRGGIFDSQTSAKADLLGSVPSMTTVIDNPGRSRDPNRAAVPRAIYRRRAQRPRWWFAAGSSPPIAGAIRITSGHRLRPCWHLGCCCARSRGAGCSRAPCLLRFSFSPPSWWSSPAIAPSPRGRSTRRDSTPLRVSRPPR